MKKNQFSQVLGLAGLILIIIGAALYAVNYANRTPGFAALGAGIVLLAVTAAINMESLKIFAKKRSSRYSANMLIMIILFTAILAVAQTLSTRHNARFDLTRNSRFSLAGQTESLLKNLKKDIDIIGFFKKSSPDKIRARDLIDQYSHKTSRLRYEFIDPDRNPQAAKDLGVTNYGTIVVKCGEKKELLNDLDEEALTNAILKVTRDVAKAVYFLTGHGEKDIENNDAKGFAIAKDAIIKEGYNVNSLSLFEEEFVPDDAFIVIIAGPAKDLFSSEIAKLRDYLAKGRNALVMLDPQVSLPEVDKFLDEYGISCGDNVIIDPFSKVFGADYTIPVVTRYEQHPITKGFNVATFFPLARSVQIDENLSSDITAQYLAKTGKSAWGETDWEAFNQGKAARGENDIAAPVPIAAVSTKNIEPDETLQGNSNETLKSKIVLIGDSDYANNSSFRLSGNADFFMNAISFLAEEKDLIAIRPKQSLGDRIFLTSSQGRFVFLACIVLLPALVIGFGSTIVVKRRRRG